MAIIGAILAGATVPARVMADPAYDKYTKVIALQKHILDISSLYGIGPGQKSKPSIVAEAAIAVEPTFNDLYTHLLTNFDGEHTSEAYEQATRLFVPIYGRNGAIRHDQNPY